MYCSEVTEAEISKLNPSITLYPNTPKEKVVPFVLQEFSIEACQEAIDYFNSAIDYDLYTESLKNDPTRPKIEYKDWYKQLPENNLVENLIFIENERIMCKWNCNYWQDRYYKISDHRNQFVQFSPNAPQRVNRKIRARAQRARKAINKMTLKGRQLGETTDEVGTKLQRTQYFPDVKSVIASKDSDSTAKMSRIYTDGLDRLPYWNRSFQSQFDKRKYYIFDNGSLLDLGYGTQDSIGRGSTYTVGHFTEVALYLYPELAIEDAFLNAIHESIWTFITLESTAEGRDDWFHKAWKDLVLQQEKGTTSFVTRFYPWPLRDDIKPTETWIRGRADAYERFIPSTEILAHAKKLESFIRLDSDLRSELPNWILSREKMFWYETERNAKEAKGQLRNFLKEQPSDPEEAFQHAGSSIYDINTITRISDAAQTEIPEVYKLRGDPSEIPPEFHPTYDEIKYEGKIIHIHCDWNPSIPYSDFELVEINFNGWADFNPINKFLIWEHPLLGADYGFGIDTSDGLGYKVSDDAVIQGVKKGTIDYKDKQVCEFASPEISQLAMWPFLIAVGTYYSPAHQALMAISIDEGRDLITQMMNRGWYNHYESLDTTKLMQGEQKVRKVGFETNRFTRPELISHVNSFIIGNWIDIYSLPLVSELKDLEKKVTISQVLGMRKEKIAGKKDNRFMALGMCLYALHRNEFLGLQKAAWAQRVENENSKVTMKKYGKDPWETDGDLESLRRVNLEDIYGFDESNEDNFVEVEFEFN